MTADAGWFQDARYGMFVHWGPYSVAARGEWVLNRERIPQDEYLRTCVQEWRAENWDPDALVALAEEAGMGYLVLTTQHHDGFSLWDSQVNPFNAVRLGPGRDLVADFVSAVRRSHLKLGFYFSPAAWYHPDYPGPFFRDWPGEKDWSSEEARLRFIADYTERVRELMTRYGKVDLLWWDGCIPGNIHGAEVNRMVRELQPGILINERNGGEFDFRCAEQTVNPKEGPWESCITMNNSWAYSRHDHNWKSAKDVIRLLVSTAGAAGNLLLNVGPRADGSVPEEARRILREVGAWLRRNRAFLARSGRQPFSWNLHHMLPTVKGEQVFLHFFEQTESSVCWPEIRNEVKSARFLASGETLRFRQEGDRFWLLDLPSPLPDSPVCTVVLDVDGPPQALTSQTSFWIPE